MFAWAKDAPPTQMPPDVGFAVSPDDQYLVLQVHYAHGLPEKDHTGLKMIYQEERYDLSCLTNVYLSLSSVLIIGQ